ncbi:MAG: hypothetical protein ACI959_001801 [Limisphaerales bacterium]|jgi:hypothetical protein
MKRSFYSFCFLLIIGLTVSAQVQLPLNGSFENWSMGDLLGNSYDSLDYWDTPQRLAVALEVADTVTFMTDDAVEGDKAVLLITKLVNIAGLIETEIPGTMSTGKYFVNLFTQEFGTTGGQALTCTPTNVIGSYKYAPVMDDTAQILVTITRWNGTSRDTLADILNILPIPQSEYIAFDFPINYTSTETPDTITLTFLSSGVGGVDGSTMYVDNVVLTGGDCVTGLDFFNTAEKLDVVPNPATNYISLNLPIQQSMNATITDLAGRTVSSVQVQPGMNNLEVMDLNDGMYFINIEDEGRIIYTGKFEKL